MKNFNHYVFAFGSSLLLSACMVSETNTIAASKAPVNANPTQPNILWIITDDQRPDSVSYYNQNVFGSKDSPLGFVDSPNIDALAAEGVLFTRAFTNSPVCGPSRGSMASGRYPFRHGHYAFELTHQEPDFVKPTVSQTLREKGYGTAAFGKEDSYIYQWGPGQGFNDAGLYDYKVHFKHDLQANNLGDIFTKASYDYSGPAPKIAGVKETVLYQNGDIRGYFLKRNGEELTQEDLAQRQQSNEEFEIIRSYTRFNKNLILGGENPKKADQAVDAYIVKEMQHYLENADQRFETSWGAKAQGADSSKPQFINLGFRLPHTPVLPPKRFRDKFKDKIYDIPDFEKQEVDALPEQLRNVYNAMKTDETTDEEKQQMIRDYYAFCAYGDYLIGKAVATFKQYSESRGQEYLIVYTVGDHGWHLGEQGISAKFGPWVQSVQNAAIVVSSDKSKVPAGKVINDMVEFVDFSPTFLTAAGVDTSDPQYNYLDGQSLFHVIDGSAPKREYVLGELNLVAGPRAYLHTDQFRFSMRTRPFNGPVTPNRLGKDLKWGLTAPAKDVEMALYDLRVDPDERRNVAYDPNYAKLANWFRQKLGNVVLGDARIEVVWAKANDYHLSNFAQGADDKKADIPREFIPSVIH